MRTRRSLSRSAEVRDGGWLPEAPDAGWLAGVRDSGWLSDPNSGG